MTECDHCWPLTAAEAVWVDGDIATQRDRHVHNRFFIRRKSLQTKKSKARGKGGVMCPVYLRLCPWQYLLNVLH